MAQVVVMSPTRLPPVRLMGLPERGQIGRGGLGSIRTIVERSTVRNLTQRDRPHDDDTPG